MTAIRDIVIDMVDKTRGLSVRKLLWLLEHGSMVSRGACQTARTERWRRWEKHAAFRVLRVLQGETVTPSRMVKGKPAISGTLAYAAWRGRVEGKLRRLAWFVDQGIPGHPGVYASRSSPGDVVADFCWVERLERYAGLTARGSLRQDLDVFVEQIESELAVAVLARGHSPPASHPFAPSGSGISGDIGT